MSFLLRPQIILLSLSIATPSYAIYECRRLTKLYPRRKPEHFSPVLIPPRPCTQHVPRSQAVVFSARLHGDVLYAARRKYLKEHASELDLWADDDHGGGEDEGGKQKPRSAFDYGDDVVSLNELWARTWLGCTTISREARWYGILFDRHAKRKSADAATATTMEKNWSASGTAAGSLSIHFNSSSESPLKASASAHTSSSASSTNNSWPTSYNTLQFSQNQPILRGIFTVIRPPSEHNGLLFKWDVPHSALVRWSKIERFMGMWMPWRIFSGGKQMLDVVPIWENGGLWVDVRYSCAQFFEDDMSEDPLHPDSPDERRDKGRKSGGDGASGGLFGRIRHPGASISGVDRRKEIPGWARWLHEMYARKLLDEAVRKIVKDARADWGGDGGRRRVMRIEDVADVAGTRIVEDEGSIMKGREGDEDSDAEGRRD